MSKVFVYIGLGDCVLIVIMYSATKDLKIGKILNTIINQFHLKIPFIKICNEFPLPIRD
jgi:hypothetical protein